ncbi:uncharacterized protein Dwil_GK27953 [Drosophila willistoni]|uniref:trypsin n=1 Tax=Drosophila willistoni TaxID=7260 RepID=A0A0Q9X5D2_DROWI|nr:seminase [Drosophila willistoni]KRF99974.1 uncharacterized protein Dwil_GK27953 [Drosophila willistoni]
MNYLHLFLCLVLCLSSSRSRNYPRHITRLTPKNKRYWRNRNNWSRGGWQVRIVSADGAFSCGGAYIAPLLVVTSAFCIQPFRYVLDQVSVESIAYTNSDFDQFASIDTVYTPNDRNMTAGDIALVRLKSPLKGKLTEFIRLCRRKIRDDMNLTVMGYGRGKSEIQPTFTFSNRSLIVQVGERCRHKGEMLHKSTNFSFCVFHQDKQNKCHYDGGSPLIWENELCGLVSWGPWCQMDSYPDFYIDIFKAKKYIQKTEDDILCGELA